MAQGVSIRGSQAAHKEPTQGMYGLEATHPQYPQTVRWQGEVAAVSLGQDGEAQRRTSERKECSNVDEGENLTSSATSAKGHAQAEQGRPAGASKTMTSQEKPPHATNLVTNRTRDAARNVCTIPD